MHILPAKSLGSQLKPVTQLTWKQGGNSFFLVNHQMNLHLSEADTLSHNEAIKICTVVYSPGLQQ